MQNLTMIATTNVWDALQTLFWLAFVVVFLSIFFLGRLPWEREQPDDEEDED